MNTFCNKKLLMSNYERKSVKMWCYTSISRNADNSYFYIKKEIMLNMILIIWTYKTNRCIQYRKFIIQNPPPPHLRNPSFINKKLSNYVFTDKKALVCSYYCFKYLDIKVKFLCCLHHNKNIDSIQLFPSI